MLRKEKGITLVALVITIIVLLILAGVTIAMVVGDNGILTRARQAKEENELAEEVETVKLWMAEQSIGENINEEMEIPGLKLEAVAFNTTDDRTCIQDKTTEEIYADGWYYIKPEDVDFDISNSYIINPETGEVIKYEDEKHKIVNTNIVGVKEGLVYSVYPKNMLNGNSWGSATLHNFNQEDENSGWAEDGILFDGIDDGIEITDSADYSQGVTLEMYINLKGKTENQTCQMLLMKRSKTVNGYFMYISNGVNKTEKDRQLVIDIGGGGQRFYTGQIIQENTPTYITYTYNPNVSSEKGILYINGTKTETTDIGDVEKIKDAQNVNIQVGSDTHITNGEDNRYPFLGKLYMARIYNRALSEDEVQTNYNEITKDLNIIPE